MDRRCFLKTIGIGTLSLTLTGCTDGSVSKSKKPNIVVIYADDLGYADVGYHGCKDVSTPNIDSIAKNGAQFSSAYVTAPVCGPSRAGLLTGRYQQRFGFEDNPAPWATCQGPNVRVGIPMEEKTIGERMQAIGYKTALIGKIHSGQKPYNNPATRGFDLFFGFDNGASEYFFHEYKQKTPERLMRNLETVKSEPEYYTDAFGREAVNFIEQNKDNPFFLYVPFNSPHGPMQAPEELVKKYSQIKHPTRRIFAAMMDSVDTNVGKMLDKLREYGLEENTIFIFTSDNGGAMERSNYSYNTPCRDKKGSFYDGGIRVPFCLQWKGTIPATQKFDFPISTLDIMPTAITAAGGKVQESWNLDGIDLLPYLTNKKDKPAERYLYWKLLYGWAIRDEQWKLVGPAKKRKKDAEPELYNIASDIGEKDNVIDKYPKVAERLQEAWDKWNATLMPPQWGTAKELCGTHPIPM
jgi:arylsulfatase A-like enzyme